MSDDPIIDCQNPGSSAGTMLNIPAIGLICAAAVSILYNVFDLGVRIFHLMRHDVAPPAGAAPEVAMGFWIAFYAFPIVNVLALLLGPVLLWGAIQMLRRRSYGFCRITAILAIIPLSAACCCFLTLPFGIWALVLLLRPETKALFT
jgi:hypothetical protein